MCFFRDIGVTKNLKKFYTRIRLPSLRHILNTYPKMEDYGGT